MEDHRFSPLLSLLERSNRILLVTHRKPDGDAVGSIMALFTALKLLGKDAVATCSDRFPDQFHFLSGTENVGSEVPGNRDFIVTLDCADTEVDRLKYQLEDNKIHIVVTPKKGRFLKENVSFSQKQEGLDLIITVDVADIPQLGKVYEENTELFAQVPVVNIDHHVSNPGFGKFNLIDTSASSTAEILYRFIRAMEAHFRKTLITPDVATFLLSGIETDTGSFQNSNTTPRAMEIAADLMDSGARQQDIIRYLFRTKKLTTLKLWGSILNKLEVDAKHRLVWSSISQADLAKTGSRMEDSGEIIDELLVHAPEAEIVVLFKEDVGMVTVSFRSKTHEANVAAIAGEFGGGGHVQAAGAKFPEKGLAEVMTKVLAVLFAYQKKRLKLDEEGGDAAGDAAGAAEPEITQVLEGYTTVTAPKPSLEQRASPIPPPIPPQVGRGDTKAGSPLHTTNYTLQTSSEDIHHKTKAAIMAEQSQPTNGTLFAPSKLMKPDDRPKQEKRFTDEIPGYMKTASTQGFSPPKPPTPPPPPPPPKTDARSEPTERALKKADEGVKKFFSPAASSDGVKVTYNPPTANAPPTPVIPPNSVPPTVRPAPATSSNAPASMPSWLGPSAGGAGSAGSATSSSTSTMNPPNPPTPPTPPTPPPPPPPPKDPFSIGDDGFTDIERALGNL